MQGTVEQYFADDAWALDEKRRYGIEKRIAETYHMHTSYAQTVQLSYEALLKHSEK